MTLAGKNARIYLGGYDISGRSNKFTIPLSRPMKDITGFGEDGHRYFPLMPNDTFDFDGFYDNHSDTTGLRACLDAYRKTQTELCILLGTTLGDPAIAGQVKADKYNLESPVADMVTLAGAFKFEEKAEDGAVLLFPKATKTSDGNHTVIDQGAQSTDGAKAYLQVFACGGDDDLIVKVQHSSDNFSGDTTDLFTFSTATGITSEQKSDTGTIKRYVRVSWAGTPTYSATFAVVFKRL